MKLHASADMILTQFTFLVIVSGIRDVGLMLVLTLREQCTARFKRREWHTGATRWTVKKTRVLTATGVRGQHEPQRPARLSTNVYTWSSSRKT